MLPIHLKKLPNFKELDLPKYATEGSAGIDLVAAIDSDIEILPSKRALVPSGIAIALPLGYEAQVRPRSGLAFKNGITVLNTPGTIDCDYRGEIGVILVNLSDEKFTVTRGMKIAQVVIAKYEVGNFIIADELPDTKRGAGGFGSTGV
jgi:dUTP pyrophosphatase